MCWTQKSTQAELARLKQQYEGRLEIRTGVELGLQPHLQEKLRQYLENCAFDYVIGSVHLVKGTGSLRQGTAGYDG